jgi:hypothetical protein
MLLDLKSVVDARGFCNGFWEAILPLIEEKYLENIQGQHDRIN